MALLIVLGFIAVVILLVGMILSIGVKKSADDGQSSVMYPKGYWLGKGIALGLLLCVPLGLGAGILTGNVGLGIALGPAFGMGFGSAIGSILEKKHKNNIRPLTEEEKRLQRTLVVFTISLLVLGVTVLFALFYFYSRI
ncbi:hypothetical protein [Methanococcoides sp. NM1]|uniref:hypothetical protein n=1 Tax=Methanococcoides sp. NM1 TaxID=1201013 RepID=UPI001083044D|nr:hypothetical protein [Methanococcoides sp. NM1]